MIADLQFPIADLPKTIAPIPSIEASLITNLPQSAIGNPKSAVILLAFS